MAAPVITVQPGGQQVDIGDSVTFTVEATSDTPLTYQWGHNGNAIPGATAASYTIPSVSYADHGVYEAFVTNTAGTVTSRAVTLLVGNLPSLIAVPDDQDVTLGESVTFTVEATSDTPLTYQWYRGASPIVGATSASYTISNAAFRHSGEYRAYVYNLSGDRSTPGATLNVSIGFVEQRQASVPLSRSITVPGTPTTFRQGDVAILVVYHDQAWRHSILDEPDEWVEVFSERTSSGRDMSVSIHYRLLELGSTLGDVEVQINPVNAREEMSASIHIFRGIDHEDPLIASQWEFDENLSDAPNGESFLPVPIDIPVDNAMVFQTICISHDDIAIPGTPQGFTRGVYIWGADEDFRQQTSAYRLNVGAARNNFPYVPFIHNLNNSVAEHMMFILAFRPQPEPNTKTPGSLWVEGEHLHFVDGVQREWRYLGERRVVQDSVKPGSLYKTYGNTLEYASEDGDLMRLETDGEDANDSTLLPADAQVAEGSLWIENDSEGLGRLAYLWSADWNDPNEDVRKRYFHDDQIHGDHDLHDDLIHDDHNDHADNVHDDFADHQDIIFNDFTDFRQSTPHGDSGEHVDIVHGDTTLHQDSHLDSLHGDSGPHEDSHADQLHDDVDFLDHDDHNDSLHGDTSEHGDAFEDFSDHVDVPAGTHTDHEDSHDDSPGHNDVIAHEDFSDVSHDDYTDHDDSGAHQDTTAPHADQQGTNEHDDTVHADRDIHVDFSDHEDSSEDFHEDFSDHDDAVNHGDRSDPTIPVPPDGVGEHEDHTDNSPHEDHNDHDDSGPHEDSVEHEDHNDSGAHQDSPGHNDVVPHEDTVHLDTTTHTDSLHMDIDNHTDTVHDDHDDHTDTASHGDFQDHDDVQHVDVPAENEHADAHTDYEGADEHEDSTGQHTDSPPQQHDDHQDFPGSSGGISHSDRQHSDINSHDDLEAQNENIHTDLLHIDHDDTVNSNHEDYPELVSDD